MFYDSINSAKYGEYIRGWPLTRGGWCKKLKYEYYADVRKYLLSTQKNWTNLRLSDDQKKLVQQRAEGRCAEQCAKINKAVFSESAGCEARDINIVQYLGIAADEPKRIERQSKKGIILPLVDIGWDEAYCLKWCEQNKLLSPIYESSFRGGCWFCHMQSIAQLRLLRKNYPEYWGLMLKWDKDSPVTFNSDGHTLHDFDKRFKAEEDGVIPVGSKFRWKMLEEI